MCLLKLYELYLSKCDPKRPENIFYFRPKTTQNRNIWYTCSAIGHNTLAGTVKRMFDTAGIPGFFTNHSLRATAATRLYEASIDEQLITEVTGHRSTAVCSYKRSNEGQKEQIRSILQGETMNIQIETPKPVPSGSAINGQSSVTEKPTEVKVVKE